MSDATKLLDALLSAQLDHNAISIDYDRSTRDIIAAKLKQEDIWKKVQISTDEVNRTRSELRDYLKNK